MLGQSQSNFVYVLLPLVQVSLGPGTQGARPTSVQEKLERCNATERARIAFGKSGIHGWGLFARCPMPQDSMVLGRGGGGGAGAGCRGWSWMARCEHEREAVAYLRAEFASPSLTGCPARTPARTPQGRAGAVERGGGAGGAVPRPGPRLLPLQPRRPARARLHASWRHLPVHGGWVMGGGGGCGWRVA